MPRFTHSEEEIRARHDARVAQLVAAYGSMLKVPYPLIMRLHGLNADDWRVYVAQRDGKTNETIVPADIDLTTAKPHGETASHNVTPSHSGATPGVGVMETSLVNAYSALVGSAPGLEGQIAARRALVGIPLL